MATIKELLDLPDRVRRGDFVLKLAEGIEKADKTIDSYVVTEQLVECFDQALDLIRASISENSSKGCYLHGSFGSGKSHFMAVLDLILQGNVKARSIRELADVIAKHNDWTQNHKFLLVPYHMIGKDSMEQAILGGYAEFMEKLHPKARVPGLYNSEKLLADAKRLRNDLGDEKFFARLNAGNEESDGDWGLIASGWSAESYAAAAQAAPGTPDHARLVGDLIEEFFTSMKNTSEFVELDTGLAIISRHAKDIGYDAVVLFLDELILWLASRAADVKFLSKEGPKLAKLVEASASRTVPLISFVARQRDLKELVGDNITGAEHVSFSETLDWWEARFATICLEDKNLPAIAEKRVLRPKSSKARRQIDKAFEQTARIREEVMNVLLTSQADRGIFRKIYPFSPAFMDTLVAMSFLLQRERTALKVMLQILIEQGERLQLGEIIPVGDLFDAIAEGDEAVSEDIRRNFDKASRLYEEKLRPLLERDHHLAVDDLAKCDLSQPGAKNLHSDIRLVKTLLLAALAPNVEALRGLTASRLAALNHGTIKSPIPGHETQLVLSKCKKWAAEVGELKIGDEPTNPTIGVQLTGVDTESIVNQAQSFDNKGNRLRKIKQLIFQQFGIEEKDELFTPYSFQWRGTKRYCQIGFSNVRELALEDFRAKDEEWLVIIDRPFDEPGFGPADDKANVDRFLEEYPQGIHTMVILPSFLSKHALKQLGKLVIIDNLLKGDHFSGYTKHLSPADRHTAKALLKNQQSQLQQQIINYLEGAYGIAKPDPRAIDSQHDLEPEDHFQSLMPALQLKPPIGSKLEQAFVHLLHQALDWQFPGHPLFESDIKFTPVILRKVFAEVEKATQAEGGRIAIERAMRADMLKIATPLKIGTMGETHFLLEPHWKDHFSKMQAGHQGVLTVRCLRQWMDKPKVMGLPKNLQDLIIKSFAVQTNRTFYNNGIAVPQMPDTLDDSLELRAVDLPTEEEWQQAIKCTERLLQIKPEYTLLNAVNVTRLANKVLEQLNSYRESSSKLLQTLEKLWETHKELDAQANRLTTAKAADKLVASLLRLKEHKLILKLARRHSEKDNKGVTDAAIGSSLRKATSVIDIITRLKWEVFDTIGELEDSHRQQATSLLEELKAALEADELVTALESKLKTLESQALALINEVVAGGGGKKEPKKPPQGDSGKISKKKLLASGECEVNKEVMDQELKKIRKVLSKHKNAKIKLNWEVYESEK